MTSLLHAHAVAIVARLHPTDLQVGAGELIALVGPNGGGKTSLLRACAGIERTSGRVHLAGEELELLPPARRAALLGYLPASRDVIWPIRARDVIALGPSNPSADRIDELIDRLELEPLASRPIDRLSTGERARVLLARAIAAQPRVLLLDEPLSNLDPYWVLRILELLRELASEGAAVLVAVHDIERTSAFDRVLLIDQGRVRADLPPASMSDASEFSQAFRITRRDGGWQLNRPADPRSSR